MVAESEKTRTRKLIDERCTGTSQLHGHSPSNCLMGF